MLTLVIPNQTSPNRQRAQVYLWSAVVIIIYSVLVSLFRVKNRGKFRIRQLGLHPHLFLSGYPFRLFL